MIGFGIDQVQAEYVAEIKLRNINKEYILKRVAGDGAPCRTRSRIWRTRWPSRDASGRSSSPSWRTVKKKYAVPRRTEIVYSHEMPEEPEEEPAEDYPVHLFLSREGYFKKITPQSLRMSGEQKFKEGDSLRQYFEATNRLGAAAVHRQISGLQDPRQRVRGDARPRRWATICPAKLGMDAGESVIWPVSARRLQRQRGVLLRKRPARRGWRSAPTPRCPTGGS